MNSDTNQTELQRDSKGRIIGGVPPAGFNVHPENRSNGRWKAENSISYNYNKILAMTDEQFEAFKPNTRAEKIALARVKAAENEKFGLPDAKEITDRTEGKAPQSVDLTSSDGSMTPTVIIEGVYADRPKFRPNNQTSQADDMAENSSNQSS